MWPSLLTVSTQDLGIQMRWQFHGSFFRGGIFRQIPEDCAEAVSEALVVGFMGDLLGSRARGRVRR